MKILINASTLKGTGAVQVATSFINECKNFDNNEYVVFLSPQVKSNLDLFSFGGNFKFHIFSGTPLYSFKGRVEVNKMQKIEKLETPDITFSVFGPSWWKPKSPHLMGFAYGYYIYPDSPYWEKVSLKTKIQILIMKCIHRAAFKQNGQYYVCETDDVSKRLGKYFNINNNNIFRVYNTASSVFLNYKKSSICERDDNEYRFFTLCSPYKHKNLTILNKVVPLLKKKLFFKTIKFYVTFPEEDYLKLFEDSVRDCIINVGPLSVNDCPELIEKCDALFLPTLLECYSANYPEAMSMGKPIITSNLSFAKTICKDAALYFNPLDATSIVDTIETLISNYDIKDNLISNGYKRLTEFGSANDRALEYLKICREISTHHTNKELEKYD